MKYVYQQILAFFALILITVSTTGILIIQYVTTNVYDEKEAQLYGYAESIIDQKHDDPAIGKWFDSGVQPGRLVCHL